MFSAITRSRGAKLMLDKIYISSSIINPDSLFYYVIEIGYPG